MQDAECVRFLQSVLPRLQMRWSGFRKVRRQVCRGIQRRMRELGFGNVDAYREYLEAQPGEWQVLDGLCCVTISRFYRDKGVFDALGATVLPELAERALSESRKRIEVWSAGCGSGEEPYTVALLWQLGVQAHYPESKLRILATDADRRLLRRAARACYPKSAVREIPEQWLSAFSLETDGYVLAPPYKAAVQLLAHDLRSEPPSGPFDLVLCRNMAFTYWDEALQIETLRRVERVLRQGGYLVIGTHEELPIGAGGFRADDSGRCLWKKG